MIEFNTKPDHIAAAIASASRDAWVGEFSGRDSVAAILKAFEEDECTYVLPVASFAGTEYGDTRDLMENHAHLKARIKALYGDRKQLGDLIFYSDPYLWGLMNGRYVAEIIRRYGFYSPCIGCHAYFHLLRIPVAKRLGNVIISGERESHDGRVKLNQLPEILDFFVQSLEAAGVRLLQPIRGVAGGESVESLIGWAWKEGVHHPACTYSGNYQLASGRVAYDDIQLRAFLDEFLSPVSALVAKTLQKEGFGYDRSALDAAVREILK